MHQELMTEIVVHLAHSHQQMARILSAKRQVTVRMAQLIDVLPNEHPHLSGLNGLIESSSDVTKSVISFLNGLADLEEAVADSLTHVLKAIGNTGDDE